MRLGAPSKGEDSGSQTATVVEDFEDTRRSMERRLLVRGFRVARAKGGRVQRSLRRDSNGADSMQVGTPNGYGRRSA